MTDRYDVIALPSLTGALRAEGFLQNAGVPARVVKLPAGSTKKGCAYGLEMPGVYLDDALRMIEGARIRHGEVLRS